MIIYFSSRSNMPGAGNDGLPEQFYIRYYYGEPTYRSLGMSASNHLSTKETQEDFVDFIKNKSRFKSDYDTITSNMNSIGYLFIDPCSIYNIDDVDDDMDTCSYEKWERSPMISKKIITERYPEIYQMLLNGRKVVIAWVMGHANSHCKEHVNKCDFLESRINHDLFSTFRYTRLLLNHLKSDGDAWFPDEVSDPLDTVFWYYCWRVDWCASFDEDDNIFCFDTSLKERLADYYSTFVWKVLCALCDFHAFMRRTDDSCHNPFDIENPQTLHVIEQYIRQKSDEER